MEPAIFKSSREDAEIPPISGKETAEPDELLAIGLTKICTLHRKPDPLGLDGLQAQEVPGNPTCGSEETVVAVYLPR